MTSRMADLATWLLMAEDEHLECKEAKNNFHFEKLVKYCCALANEGGGRMILGVTDQPPRRVVGTSAFDTLERTKAGLIEKLRLRVDVEEIAHPDGRVLVFEVPPRPIGLPIQVDGAYWMRGGEDLVAMTPDQLRRILAEAQPDFSAEVWALAESHGQRFGARIETPLRMFPRPEGTDAHLVERLVGRDGMTPAALMEIVERNRRPELDDEGREAMIVTTLSFRTLDPERMLAVLRRASPEFDEEAPQGDDVAFAWTREYPKGHWSPFARSGGRQILGSVSLAKDGILRADARTLSMAAVLASKLRTLAGGDVRLERAEWTDVSMMSRAGAKS